MSSWERTPAGNRRRVLPSSPANRTPAIANRVRSSSTRSNKTKAVPPASQSETRTHPAPRRAANNSKERPPRIGGLVWGRERPPALCSSHRGVGRPNSRWAHFESCCVLIYFFSAGGAVFTLCQGSLMGFGLVAHDDAFLVFSYCSSICLASRRCCAFGSSLCE